MPRSDHRAFAVPSSINGKFSITGAGTAAYRFSRQVSRPGVEYVGVVLAHLVAHSLSARAFALGLLFVPLAVPSPAAESISVIVDQAKLIKLPEKVATIVVGNPLIADVSLQPGGMMVVTGKGYGSTNVMALDRQGTVLVDRMVQVEGPAINFSPSIAASTRIL